MGKSRSLLAPCLQATTRSSTPISFPATTSNREVAIAIGAYQQISLCAQRICWHHACWKTIIRASTHVSPFLPRQLSTLILPVFVLVHQLRSARGIKIGLCQNIVSTGGELLDILKYYRASTLITDSLFWDFIKKIKKRKNFFSQPAVFL